MNIKRNNIINIALISLFLYLIFHTIYGNRGVISYYRLKVEIEDLSKQLDESIFTRIILETQVKNLSSNNIDMDLFDEIARKSLMLSEPDEQVIINKLE
jgi:cell division protein FtsB